MDAEGTRNSGSPRTSVRGSQYKTTRSSVSQAVHQHNLRTGTVFGVTFNTLTNVMGAGVLSLPYAMYNGSVIISMVLLFLCASITCFTSFILTLACDVVDKWSYTEVFSFTAFPDVPLHEQDAVAAVANPTEDIDEGIVLDDEPLARKRRRQLTMFMEAVVLFTNFGTVVIYSRVIADSIPPVLRNFFGASGVWTAEWLWLVAPAVLFFALSCVRSMEELKITSIIGFLTIFYIVVAIIVRYFTDIDDPISTDPSKDEIIIIHAKMSSFSTLATYALAFGYHFNVPYFYYELKDRRTEVMMDTVKIAFPIITACYAATGLMGYLTFGALVAEKDASGDIVNNYPDNDVLMNIGRLGLFFHFASVYPILSVCARRGLHRLVCMLFAKKPSKGENGALIEPEISKAPPGDPSTTRMTSIVIEALAIVSGSTVIAAFVPGIGVVVELIGTIFNIPSVIIIPGFMGTRLFDERIAVVRNKFTPARIKLYRYISWFCFGTGCFFLVCGLISFIYARAGGK